MIITPPNYIVGLDKYPSFFLAGSIENGAAREWQKEFCDQVDSNEVVILNPRRPQWDSTWRPTVEEPRFVEQVEWELQGQETVDKIIMYFHPDTKSPISLLELGIFANSGRLVVCCPRGFWRKGNVDLVCRHYDIMQVEKFEDLIKFAKGYLELRRNSTGTYYC
jgi:hypothetical protein